MDFQCILGGNCNWNKLDNGSYELYIKVCKEIAENIKKNKNITDNRLLDNVDKYNNMNKYLDEKTFAKIKKNSLA